MTSTSNLADVVRHYQRSIERHGEDTTRLLHCITKLFNLPIKFEHLQETGIGKTVNALRKFNGEVGVAAKTLVTKWKAMVAAEEEPADGPATTGHNSNEDDSNGRSYGRRSSDEDHDQENKGSNSSSGEETRSRHKTKDEKRSREHTSSKTSEHKSKSAIRNHHSSSSSSKSHSKLKSDGDKKHKSSRSDKVKDNHSHKEQRKDEKSKSERKAKQESSSSVAKVNSNKSSSSDDSNTKQRHHSKSAASSSSKSEKHNTELEQSKSSSSTHDKSKEDKSHHSKHKSSKERANDHKSSAASSSTKSSKRSRSSERNADEATKPKIPKIKAKLEAVSNEDTADGFDSTMGANFDDVLGMLNMPMSSKKSSKVRSPNKPPQTSVTTAASSSSAKRRISPPVANSSLKLTSTRKPELLTSTAKLEPLDPSIALELPTISNNYKPMPLNQTVMDVVFNHSGNNNTHKSTSRVFNESEALAQGISSKTMRTKIYSGVKTGQILQVPSLFDLCTRVLQKNIDALEYTGGVPFEVLRSVLERATPQQLLNFEEYNPYLMDDSEVLWQQHVQRHCRSQRREEMETWREMFLRCQEEKERKLSILAESIKASQKISEAPVRKTQLAFVDSLVKPPRNVQRKQEQFGTKGKLIATPAARVAALSSVTPNAAKVGDARLRVVAATRDTAQASGGFIRPKKAPLMAKTLQFMRGRHKR